MTPPLPPPPPPPPAPRRRRNMPLRVGIILMVVVGLVYWWTTGALDRPLSTIGLNYNACVRGIAGTYCGDDARRLCSVSLVRDAPACRAYRSEND